MEAEKRRRSATCWCFSFGVAACGFLSTRRQIGRLCRHSAAGRTRRCLSGTFLSAAELPWYAVKKSLKLNISFLLQTLTVSQRLRFSPVRGEYRPRSSRVLVEPFPPAPRPHPAEVTPARQSPRLFPGARVVLGVI